MTRISRIIPAFIVLTCAPALAVADEAVPTITLTDGVIAPQMIDLAADTAVTLTVSNTGKTAAEFESKRLRIEKIIAPGQTETIDLPALPAGNYPFVEEFHEDLDTAKGTIVVK
ncbi:cupredoxin domain-containing protein [Thioclava sp. JE_KL1]|uniref:cupredoxin domain-containing protein n=1 Tax=Thioclava sp. JE_KL1 TaxID=2651187 RepID=UPI00128CF72E|nr:cupredoxin domain-containing protein [Thioclava sp. JE_KL1]MPQ93267.1 cupredoxin domain-containing protein [Thioclava sp. JE_KL1]